jgi:hypothetical protein
MTSTGIRLNKIIKNTTFDVEKTMKIHKKFQKDNNIDFFEKTKVFSSKNDES